MSLDVAIFGGGAAGLWLLDELTRRGCHSLLFEAQELGQGQTVACQGIIHGGLKYTLDGLLTPSARSIRQMPQLWRACLAGERPPDLSRVRVRSDDCYLWRTETIRSRVGMIGARYGLRTVPTVVPRNERPPVLAPCSGTVVRVAEPVIDPQSFLQVLAERHRDRLLVIRMPGGVESVRGGPAPGPRTPTVRAIRVQNPRTRAWLELNARWIVFAAGAGNAVLRRAAGLTRPITQHRPLHMVLVRGTLPKLNGHCVDGARTRVTITWDQDRTGRIVWQLGGQIAEDGVAMESDELLRHALRELHEVLPGLDFSETQWATYRVDRAERQTSGGKRPPAHQIVQDGNCLTIWPTKLALVPKLAADVAQRILGPPEARRGDTAGTVPAGTSSRTGLSAWRDRLTDWPRPRVAQPPWERCHEWFCVQNGRLVAIEERRAA
ncbi:MAG TPA: FAD-dependent oxidoreductase [Planctomycetaceae bacterium]|nr:FAD-dependent oxidoreductase [Planctomycetaceae bacterium]